MKKRITACLLVIVLFSGSVIGTYDRAEASSVVIGTVGVAEFILSLLASAGVTYITVDTLTQGWGSQSKKAYEELAAQLEQSYEGRRLEVIEGGGGEQPPQWDKFMDAAITAKTVEYTPGIWDCVKHAINEVMKTRYDVEKNGEEGFYTAGTLYLVNQYGELQYPIAVIHRGYVIDSGYSADFPDLNKAYSKYLQEAIENKALLFSEKGSYAVYKYPDRCLPCVKLYTGYDFRHYFRLYFNTSMFNSDVYDQDVTVYTITDKNQLSSSTAPGYSHDFVISAGMELREYILPPFLQLVLGDGLRLVGNDVSPDAILPSSSDTWKNSGNLDTLPQPAPVNFPTADQIQALIDALNQANNNHSEDEEQKKNEQSSAVDDFIGDLTKPEPGTKPDPGTDPEPDTKPDPGTDPEPDTKPDPGIDPEPDIDPKPDTELEPFQLEVDLTTIFPFCIPFDLIKLLSVLDAEPETPVFDLNLPSLSASGEVVSNEFTVDLSSFNGLMEIVRMGELLVFLIGLAVLTGHVIKW